MPSQIHPCGCEHKYQDAKYGKGQRVHNEAKSTKVAGTLRCTVCGRKS